MEEGFKRWAALAAVGVPLWPTLVEVLEKARVAVERDPSNGDSVRVAIVECVRGCVQEGMPADRTDYFEVVLKHLQQYHSIKGIRHPAMVAKGVAAAVSQQKASITIEEAFQNQKAKQEKQDYADYVPSLPEKG